MDANAPQLSPPTHTSLAEPFSQIFIDRDEATWAFDLLLDTVKRLGMRGPDDARFALTLPQQAGKLCLHLNFGQWLVLGFRGPSLTTPRVDMALLADRVAWNERFVTLPSARKEGDPEVRSYHLPLETVRPLTSDLRAAYEATLDFIAGRFRAWKRSPYWKQHHPEIVEALFDSDKRAQLFAGLLAETDLRYERHFTAFHQEIGEEEGGYEVDMVGKDENKTVSKYPLQRRNDMNLDNRQTLATPFSNIFISREEAEWAFDFLLETCTRLGIKNSDDKRFAITLRHGKTIHKKRTLRLNFGNWAIVSFYDPSRKPNRLHLNLITAQINIDTNSFKKWGAFSKKEDEPEVCGYELPIEFIEQDNLHWVYNNTLDYTANKFQNWQGCIWRKHHISQIAEAIFDSEKREKLLNEGLNQELLVQIEDDADDEIDIEFNPLYPLSDLSSDTGLDEAELSRWLRAIERKGQAILYGPPGTGKTFVAQKLAQHLVGGGDGLVDLVQFHPAYAYEDFIQGLRPQAKPDGGLDYPLVPGRFLDFCRQTALRRNACVLIIDEINRANLARVFGELMYLLEYRDQEIPLAGGGVLRIPANVRLIATMNTADRSIALVDHALRRRFAFIALAPNFDILRRYHLKTGYPVEKLVELLTRLNHEIADVHYAVGITFFLREDLASQLEDIWRMEIEPYLEEYFFDQPDKVAEFRWDVVKQKVSF